MKLNLSFSKLYTPKIGLLLGWAIVLISATLIALGLIAVLPPAPTMASLQSGAPPSPAHRVSGSLGLTQTTNLTTTQIPPIDPNVQNLELVGHFSATVKSFYVQQDYAYLATGEKGLQIIDVSDPTAPTLAGTYEISGALVSVVVTGTVAVALDDAGNMLLLDVSTPAAPVELGQLPDIGYQVVVADNYAYIPAGNNGLRIVDISRPSDPTEVGVYQAESVSRVAVAGDYAYLLADFSLKTINISNPKAPTEISSYPVSGSNPRLKVVEDRLYLSVQVVLDWVYVKIFDLSDPAAPILIETEPEMPVNVMEIFSQGSDIAAGDDKLYILDDWSGLRMIDVSNPARPIEIGFYKQDFEVFYGKVVVAGDYVYVTDPEDGLFIFKPQPVEPPKPDLSADLTGHFGGETNTVFVDDNYAYVGFGPEMAILDVSDPTTPRRIAYLVLAGKDESTVQAITVVEPYAYVADSYGLWVVDVSDPTQPFVVGHALISGGWNTDVTVVGQYAYLTQFWSSGESGSRDLGHGYFKVVDVSDPAQPFEVSTFKTSSGGSSNRGARAVQVIDNYAFVADSQEYGLRLFDISNPAEPIEVRNSRGATNIGAADFVLRDGYAYITNGSQGGFRVVMSPAPLNTIGIYASGRTGAVALIDGIYETPGYTGAVALIDNYAYFVEDPPLVDFEPEGDYGLRIVDISNPISPTATAFYTTATHITDLTIKDHHAYFTMQGTLRILDLSDPTEPVEIGAYQTPPSASKISVDDNQAYVVTGGRWWEDKELQVVDISNPAQPVTIERAATDLGPTTPVVDSYAYLIDDGDLRILDVSNPATLTQVGVYTSVTIMGEIVTRGDFAYLASNYRLAVLDLSDPTAPAQVYSYTLPPTDQYDLPAPDLALIDDYLYLVSASAGLRIFDISEPSQPVEVKTDQEIAGEHLVVDNDYAYVTTKGLQILDISDPASPVIVGATEVGLFGVRWSIKGIAVDDTYAYLIDDVVGLRVIDISNPTAPVEVGFSPIPGYPEDLAVANDGLVAATRKSGLFLFQLTPPGETSPSTSILQPVPAPTPTPTPAPTTPPTPPPTNTPIPAQSKNINLVGHFENKVGAISVQGDYAYAEVDEALLVLDISNRARPREIGRVALPGRIIELIIVDDYAYVTHSRSLSVISLADLSKPAEVSRYELKSYSLYTTIAGHYAYLGDNSGLSIIDISNPISPSLAGFYPEPYLKYTTIVDDYALTPGHFGLFIIDISDPISPSLIGRYSHPYGNSAYKATVAGDYVYLADSYHGLQTIDISNPAKSIRVKANIRQQGIVAIREDYLYVAGSDGLQVLDISNPPEAVEISSIDVGPRAKQIIIEGNYAYVLREWPDQLQVIDISDPTTPIEAGFYATPENAYDFILVDDYIYVNDGEEGLFILQFTGSTSNPTVN